MNQTREYLPEDLILEIFSHLPPTSLLRFKSISKSLHTLISNPDFLCRNTVRRGLDPSPPLLPPPPGILLKRQDSFHEDSNILIFPSPPPPPSRLHGDGDHGYYSSQLLQKLIDYRPEHDQPEGNEKVIFTVTDSCNGLLLYLNCVRHRNPPGGKCIWYVCNPITKDYIKLPPLLEGEGFKILDYSPANIVFDPSLSLTYKVVIWLQCRYNNYSPEDEKHYRLYVYSSETRSWRLSYLGTQSSWKLPVSTIDCVLQNQFSFEFRAVLLKGVLYWSTTLIGGGQWLSVSLCYDVEKDLVWILKLPKKPVEYERRALLYFGVCGGSLRLIEKYYKLNHHEWMNVFPCSFDVMELQQEGRRRRRGESWTVKYRVNFGEEGYYANLIRECSLFGVCIWDLYKTTIEGEEEMLLNINNCLIISFNLSNNTFGKELQIKKSGGFLWFTNVLRYTITLFPLH